MNFVLREEDHTYWLDQRRMIGVTEALSVFGRRGVDPFYLERGRIIHKAIEYYNQDELDESTIDDRIRPYFNARIKFGQDTGFKPIYIEKKLYHPKYFYAGRIDEIGILNDSLAIIDDKSGQKNRIDELQEVAYWELATSNEIKVKKLFDLYLMANGNYHLEPVKSPKLSLLPVFLAAFKCVQWKEGMI